MTSYSERSSVAITGAGWVTPLGSDLGQTWQALLDGRDAFAMRKSLYKLRNALCAMVPDVADDLPASERLFRMISAATGSAARSAGINLEDERLVVIIGTSFGDSLDGASDQEAPFDKLAAQLTEELRFRRTPVFLSTACSSGSDALAVGYDLICAGVADACLCGGADVLTEVKRLAHSCLGTMSPTHLRAFDASHDGTLLGEGAGFLVLENANSVGSRPVLGRLLGYGAANDAASMTAPDPNASGARLAIERALTSSNMGADDVAAFCAHGSGTVLNDDAERDILNQIFATNERLVVFATKGALGHSLGATGAIEAIALLLALRSGFAPPIVGLEKRDASLLPITAAGQPEPLSHGVGLSLTLGFGGFDTCLVLAAKQEF